MTGNKSQVSKGKLKNPLSSSRVFRLDRQVALSDAEPSGRLRLDACARYLQDVAAFDAIDANISDLGNWVLRQNSIQVSSFPTYGQWVRAETYLTGSGRAWIERSSTISDLDSGKTLVTANAIWVLTHNESGSPISVPQELFDIYGPMASVYKVSARGAPRPELPVDCTSLEWQIRFSDQDILSHLNNAVYFEPLEEVLNKAGIVLPLFQLIESQVTYRESITYGDPLAVFYRIKRASEHVGISIYFVTNNLVRANIDLHGWH